MITNYYIEISFKTTEGLDLTRTWLEYSLKVRGRYWNNAMGGLATEY